MVFVYREQKYFPLDSLLRASLTLRDYSKVCYLHNKHFSDPKILLTGKFGGHAMPLLVNPRAARWLVVLFCLFASTLVLAQSTGGRIIGKVSDPSGAVLGDVSIILLNQA